MKIRMVLALAAFALAVAVVGCGGSGDSSDKNSSGDVVPPAQLTATGPDVKIAPADFAKWSDISDDAEGFECEHPRMVFGDTGEAIDHADKTSGIKSKLQPTFQCIDADHTFWAIPRKNRKDAISKSNANAVASNFSGVSVRPRPKSAPAGATCLEYTEGPRYTCFFAWRNLTLMSTSTKSLDDAGAVLTGGLATVEAIY
jgi:hypothetical protein